MNRPPLNGQLICSIELLRRVMDASPRALAAIVRVLDGDVGGGHGAGSGRSESRNEEERFVFCRVGTQWRVVFEGGTAFYLIDTLGTGYLDYLLHHENEAIRALDLEKEIQPEKAKVRARGSIPRTLEGPAARAKLRELETLRAEREEARDAGDEGWVNRLDREIESGESELEGVQPGDAGARARSNVSQAVGAVRRRLEKGNRKQRAFAEHLKQCLNLGFECMYIQPAGNIWR